VSAARRKDTATAPMSEADYQRRIIDAAHAHHWRVAHFRPARTERSWVTPVAADGKGFPDLILVRDSVLAIEVKTAKGRVSSEQHEWLGAFAAAGVRAMVARPADWSRVLSALCGGMHPTPRWFEEAES
jgi:hypothetical protein